MRIRIRNEKRRRDRGIEKVLEEIKGMGIERLRFGWHSNTRLRMAQQYEQREDVAHSCLERKQVRGKRLKLINAIREYFGERRA